VSCAARVCAGLPRKIEEERIARLAESLYATHHRAGLAGRLAETPHMKARVIVTLKSGILDPQGKAIENALKSMNISRVGSVRQGKVFDIEVAGDAAGAEAQVKAACERLLANLIVEDYRIEMV
jgi:phosphoribosylformylglycinamidine synthase